MAENVKTVSAYSVDKLQKVLGNFDENANVIMRELGVNLHIDGLNIVVGGEEEKVATAADVLECLVELAEEGEAIDKSRIL